MSEVKHPAGMATEAVAAEGCKPLMVMKSLVAPQSLFAAVG